MTGKWKASARSEVEACWADWTSREMQLVRLHEEILSRREALLNCSSSYNRSQGLRHGGETTTSEQAYLRNHRLLQDIRKAKQEVQDALNTSPTPRFMTLQKNYWAMVKSQVPMWEQDLGITRHQTTRSTPRDKGTRPAAQESGSRSKTPSSKAAESKSPLGIKPKKRQSKKKLDERHRAAKTKN